MRTVSRALPAGQPRATWGRCEKQALHGSARRAGSAATVARSPRPSGDVGSTRGRRRVSRWTRLPAGRASAAPPADVLRPTTQIGNDRWLASSVPVATASSPPRPCSSSSDSRPQRPLTPKILAAPGTRVRSSPGTRSPGAPSPSRGSSPEPVAQLYLGLVSTAVYNAGRDGRKGQGGPTLRQSPVARGASPTWPPRTAAHDVLAPSSRRPDGSSSDADYDASGSRAFREVGDRAVGGGGDGCRDSGAAAALIASRVDDGATRPSRLARPAEPPPGTVGADRHRRDG